MKSNRLDAAAIGLSGLCLIHCLAMPVFASFLPIFGTFAENEWFHKAMVLAAFPVSVIALVRSKWGRDRTVFAALAVFGMGLLLAGAFVHELHDFERPLTIIGAVFLVSAHAFRWLRHGATTI